jgi:ABC-type multidrug transport system fused ATPase/permease subunit
MSARGDRVGRRGVAAESRNWHLLEPFLPPRSRLRMVSVGVGSFVGGLAESGVLVLMTLVAESLIRGADTIEVLGRGVGSTAAIVVALVLILVRVVLTLVTADTAAVFSAEVMGRAQRSLLDAYLSTSHAVRSLRPPGDLQAVMISNGRFTGDLANAFAQVAASICGLLAFGVTSLVINPIAFVAIAAVGGLLVVVLRPLRRRSRAAARSFERTNRGLGHEVAQIEGLHREVRVFRVESAVRDRVGTDIASGGRRFRTVRFLGQAVPQVFQSVLMAAAVLGLLTMLRTVESGSELATAGAVVLLLVRSMSSAQQLVTANQRVIELGSYTRGLSELIEQFRTDEVSSGAEVPARLVPVELRSVGFAYDARHPVFDGLDLRFDPGEVVGVVGPSGAGKSTLVELLLHLREPSSGSVTYGGVPVGSIDPAHFAARIAIVPQNAVLIDGSVAENVAFFRDLPESRVREALAMADLEREVEALPDGIHTRLGSDERALSGGQRQRLTIARALAGRPEVLVLDEPTSALDARSESVIAATIGEGREDRVTLVVAHRHSTLRSCTRILVVDSGRIAADGTPDEVAAVSAFFRSMLDSEAVGATDEPTQGGS